MAAGSGDAKASARVIERHSIDHVPATERHGVVWHQGSFWFTGAFVIPSMLVGFIGPGLGLAPLWSVIALAVGMALGTGFMAPHANQGPKLGPPQMIQSRAQFGSLGVSIPLLVAVFDASRFDHEPYRALFDCSAAARVLGWEPRYAWSGRGGSPG